MIIIGITQIKNSTEVEQNFCKIMKSLKIYQETDVDLVLFPECSLSGFSAKIRECTLDLVSEYLSEIEKWSKEHNKYVVLPTALVDERIYNTGFIFGGAKKEMFYKIGLTDSEKNFFSIPDKKIKKVFRINDYNIAILVCYEAEMEPYLYFNEGDADLILWPGYWGWDKEDQWGEFKKDGSPNLIYNNMRNWKIPLIQSNFAFNDLSDHRSSGPHGLSMFVNKDNSLFSQAEFDKESCYKITIVNKEIKNFEKIGEL